MMWRLEALRGYRLAATDDRLGRVRDVLFDDRAWTVRYLEVETGGWLSHRRVLIVPSVLGRPEEVREEIPVSLSRRQVEESPPIEADQPVSRQQEEQLHAFYGWTPYWGASAFLGPIWPEGMPGRPPDFATDPRLKEHAEMVAGEGDPHLRSGREVEGYRIHAEDGDIGHVADFLIDEDGWRVRYLVVDAGGWLSERRVLISPDWVSAIDWAERRVAVGLTRDQVRGSPEYDPEAGVGRDYEAGLYAHYGLPPYWI